MDARPIWLIGCGNMAGAMLTGWLAAGIPASRFHVIDPNVSFIPTGVSREEAPPETDFGCAIVQLGVKPHMLVDIATELAASVGPETILTSIMAGVEVAALQKAFPEAGAVVRIMPNLPVALGKGASGLFAEDWTTDGAREVGALVERLGLAEWMAEERLLHICTALGGSGPAFIFRYIDALEKSGTALGLDPDQAQRFAVTMAEGAAILAAQSDESPHILADRVASPGGTTRKGLDILDKDGALDALVDAALSAAADRAREMAEEAKG